MLPDVRRLNREDFKDAPSWLDPMLNVLNSFMDSVYNIMDRNVSLTNNLNCQIATINVTTDNSGNIAPLKLKTTIRGRAIGMSVIRVLSDDTSIQSPFISYTQNENIISINNVAGLNNDTKYKMIVLIIGE